MTRFPRSRFAPMVALAVLAALAGCSAGDESPALASKTGRPADIPTATSTQTRIPGDPAAHLVGFTMNWGDFHEGWQLVRIAEEDGELRLWVVWDTHSREQFFVPDGMPLAAGEAEDLAALLDELGIAAWDGYASTWTDDNTGDFSFSLQVTYSDGSTITASGANDFGGRPTPDFNVEFAAIATHLRGIVERHDVEPDWGLVSSLSLSFGWSDPLRYSLRQASDNYFELSIQRSRARGTQQVVVGLEVVEQLQALVDHLGVTTWRPDIPDAAAFRGGLEEAVSLQVDFDSGLYLAAGGYLDRHRDFDWRLVEFTVENIDWADGLLGVDALATFLEWQFLAHLPAADTSAPAAVFEGGVWSFPLSTRYRSFPNYEVLPELTAAGYLPVHGNMLAGLLEVSMEVGILDTEQNLLGTAKVAALGHDFSTRTGGDRWYPTSGLAVSDLGRSDLLFLDVTDGRAAVEAHGGRLWIVAPG
ncbi:MAG: hypothetical protein FWG11_05425 [Promicromonosporaceae bacterium]|nr:hypothetical protein [Promicromonosporaceae bacterium]